MVTTVTTTTVAAAAALGLTAALGGVATVALLVLLAQRELASAAGPRTRSLARHLAVAIAPLLVVFGVIVASRLAEML